MNALSLHACYLKNVRMIRGLIILPSDALGGAEKVAMNLAAFLCEQCIFSELDIYIMSRGRTGSWEELEKKDGLNIFYNGAKSEKQSLPALFYFLIKRRKRYQFVYSTHLHVNAIVSLLSKTKLFVASFKVARESTVIFDRFDGVKGYVFRFLFRFYGAHQLLICQTNYMRKRLLEERGRKLAKNISVIPNPVDYERIRKDLDVKNIFTRVDNRFVVVMVGRLIEIKNHQLALNAIAHLLENRRLPSSFKLQIIGDGNLREELESLAQAKNIEEYIEFLGFQDRPYRNMADADLGLLTSSAEGFPNVLLEMMACGSKNIITTPCAGDLKALESVRVLPDFEITTMADAIEDAILNQNDYSSVYTEFARKRGLDQYWQAIHSFNFPENI